MSSSSSIDAEEEKRVKNIIDALKSEGLFDQFRRECLADVDTKPAYQNLRQRVEGYVSRFLSRQQWSPSLNKNQLRDNLRKQITASGMLANGVERVIEQVINPKILQLIKPKIDEVVCAHLNIDPKERQANLEKKQQQQKENLQSLMSINISQAEANQTSTPTSFQGQQSTPSFSSPYSQALWTQQMPPQVAFGGMMPNFPMVPPFGTFPPFGMPPQMFPYWNTFGMFPQAIPGMAGIPFPPPMSSAAATTVTTASSAAGGIGVSPIPPIPSTPTSTPQTKAADTPTPPKSSLPPLPPTPPPPGTEDDEVVIPKEESKDNVTRSLFTDSKDGETNPPKVLDDIPLPPGTGSIGMKIENEDSHESYALGILDDEDGDGKRPYKFAWDEDNNVDNKSELSVSSVHTSDLSSFEDLESNSDFSDSGEEVLLEEDIEVPQGSPLSVAGDREVESLDEDMDDFDAEMVEVPQSTTPDIEKEFPEKQESAEQLEVTEEDVLKPDVIDSSITVQTHEEDIPIPPEEEAIAQAATSEEKLSPPIDQQIPPLPPNKETVPLPSATEAHDEKHNKSPSKPQKLISLQYNYSDSEDEETREERKARIAKEKEERYAKRAQRRAELEAKRKEREEEKARLGGGRKKSQDKRVDESFEKGATDSSEKMERTSSVESSPEKAPSSPEKKRRKTKAELKMELTKQKVMEKKAALRRQRTRNRRYTSDEFTSIFTEKKQPFSSQSYSEVVIEEQTFEETVVTDNIEYMVDESQNQTEYQTQEVCGSMEGEVILEDGRQLKVDIIMEDMPPSPPTPTQDENTDVITIDSSADTHAEERRRAASPLSDVSDDSLIEVPKGTKRKRQSSGSRSEREPKKSQRYDTSDLYKPRPSIGSRRRRNSSPGAALEKDDYVPSASTKTSKSNKKSRSKSSRHSSRSRSRSRSRSIESGCQPSPISSSSLTSVHSRGSSSSRSRSGSSSSGSSSSGSGKSRSRSSSSGSSVDEFGRRKRRKGKMPIDMIDFGEAERMVEKNLYRVSFGEAEKRSATRRFQGNRGRGLVRGAAVGNWQRQNSWQYPPEGTAAMAWSPEGSPSKRYYYPEPGSSPYGEHGELSPEAWDADSPPYYPAQRPRRTSQMEDSPPLPPHRPQYPPVGRRPQSPPPEYLRRSLSPSEHIMARGISPDPWEESMSPPHSRGHRSQSPPYIPGRLSPSPPPYIPTRGQRSPSPGRPYVRARSPSPYRMGMRVGRSPSPPLSLSRSGHSPSPPLYSPPHRPLLRGRSPSPPPSYFVRRTPSPHRPITRGQRSPSPPIHRRPMSPGPSRPMTRGLSAQSPYDTRKKAAAAVVPKVPMTNKLRNIKFGSPYQAGSRRNRGSSPERMPSKRGRH